MAVIHGQKKRQWQVRQSPAEPSQWNPFAPQPVQWMLRLNERISSLKEHQLTCRSMEQTVSVHDGDETPTPTYQHFMFTKQLFFGKNYI